MAVPVYPITRYSPDITELVEIHQAKASGGELAPVRRHQVSLQMVSPWITGAQPAPSDRSFEQRYCQALPANVEYPSRLKGI